MTRHRMIEWLILAAVLVACYVVAAYVLWPQVARAHSWYPNECCHEQDCFEITPNGPNPDIVAQFRNGEAGYYIPASKEWFPITRLRETPPEGRDHWARCTSQGNPANPTYGSYGISVGPVCIYRPPIRF